MISVDVVEELELHFDAPFEGAMLICQQLLGERYHRCNPALDVAVVLDDATVLDQLELIAAHCNLEPTIAFIRKLWQ
jgi:hypothetical protein